MLSSIFIAALVPLATALATPRALQERSYVQAQWTGTLVDGGDIVTLNGTVQEIHAQAMKLHPDAVPSAKRDDAPALAKRNKEGTNCLGNYGYAGVDPINDGINYLINRGGTWGVGAGPATCTLISCSWNSGITLCNDGPTYINPGGVYLASYAQDIANNCAVNLDNWVGIGGQEFDTDDYNIIVGYVPC